MATHVICIGGSGLRVLRSMVMMLSAGYDVNDDIKAYIIDPHLDSTEYEFVTGLIKNYQLIHGLGGSRGFFKANLNVNANNPNGMTSISQGTTFGEFIKYNELNDSCRQIVDILYNQGNIENSMDVGFKGHPNVGCVVLQDLVNSEWFNTNFNNIPDEDRVIIVGSLFGGTGASGIQTIAQALNQKNPQLKIAAVTFIPYYTLEEPKKGVAKDVDSSAWDLKSWAALKYYSQNFQEGRCFGINTFYVIGDSDTQPIPYDETKQGNKAHFAELIAVTAIKHFNKVVQNGQGGGTLNPWNFYNTEWAQNISSDLDKKCWGTDLAEEIKCLANFYAFGKFFMMMREDRFYPVNKVFYKKISKDNNLIDRFAVLEDFIFSSKENQDSFVKWLGEMRESKRSFTAVNTDDVAYDSACNTFKFSPSTPNVVYNGVDTHIDVTMSDYFKTINDAYRKSLKVKDQTDKVVKFLNMCYDGIAKVNKVNE